MRLRRLSQIVRSYDQELYVAENDSGVACVFRRTKTYERFDIEGCVILKIVNRPHLVFALTDNWNVFGQPVDWGVEPILARLNEMDLTKRDLYSDLVKSYERAEKAKERDRDNQAESFLLENRRAFAKATDGINTALMKSDKKFKNRRISKWQL